MSSSLLTAMRDYLNSANLMTGYLTRYYRWTDQDLQGAGDFILFRMAGGGSNDDPLLQRPMMMIHLVAGPATVVTGNTRMVQIIQALRGEAAPTGMIKVAPIGGIQGPFYLDNNRAAFQINVRCFVTSH